MNLSVIHQANAGFEYDAGFSGEVFEVLEPASGQRLGRLRSTTAKELDQLVASTVEAQAGWAEASFETRAGVLRRFAGLLEQQADTINAWNMRECGSIAGKAGWELQACIDQAQMCAALPMQPTGAVYPSSLPGRENLCIRVPLGVVGVISPWNFPLLLSLRAVLPALALGNAVVLKPDPNSSVIGGVLIQQLLQEAGLPDGVCSLVLGGAALGQQLVEHPAVNMIAFTGSTAVGREIGQVCGRQLKKASLELGGNNALLVLDDADVNGAASCAAWGSFLHQGQICMQSGRHLVHRSIAEAYIQALSARAQQLLVGDPYRNNVHLGPIITPRQAERVMELIDASVALGAEVVCGGKREGAFIYPTVMRGVTPQMPIYREEIFGPVAPVLTFDTDAEAIALANDTEYGLAAAIHSPDLARARRLAQQIQAGMVHINDQTVNNEYQVPFGGMKASGNAGRFGGPENLDEFSEKKWISTLAAPLGYPF